MSHVSVNVSGQTEWDRVMQQRGRQINWETASANVFRGSHNPSHQFIHLKICHRAYLTHRVRHLMGLSPHPFCNFCPHGTLGTFMHIMWDCPKVYAFWEEVVDSISSLIKTYLPMVPELHLLNDNSKFPLGFPNALAERNWSDGRKNKSRHQNSA